MQIPTRRDRRNPKGRPDIRRIAASFVVTDAFSIASSSLLALLVSQVRRRRDDY